MNKIICTDDFSMEVEYVKSSKKYCINFYSVKLNRGFEVFYDAGRLPIITIINIFMLVYDQIVWSDSPDENKRKLINSFGTIENFLDNFSV